MTLCVAVDFDGVIHSYDRGWLDGSVYGDVDTSLLTELHSKGYAVAVMTARPIPPVVRVLRAHGFEVWADRDCRCEFWRGGPSGRTIAVTNRKVAAMAYIDDRAVSYRFGDGPVAQADVIARVADLARHRDGIQL